MVVRRLPEGFHYFSGYGYHQNNMSVDMVDQNENYSQHLRNVQVEDLWAAVNNNPPAQVLW